MFAVGANSTAIMAALPNMRIELFLSPAGVEWAVNVYLVVSAVFIVLGGQAADRFGARRASMVGLALFGVAFGIMQNFRGGFSNQNTGFSLLFTIFLLIVSVRQSLLDIYPRPGHDYIGSAVLGIHMPVWSIIIALCLLIGRATASPGRSSKPRRCAGRGPAPCSTRSRGR